MSAPGPQTPPARRVSAPTTIAYATGAVAYGIKDSGFGTFLLLFYNQVVGVAPGTVGLIIMAALVLDAFIDPAVGALDLTKLLDASSNPKGRTYDKTPVPKKKQPNMPGATKTKAKPAGAPARFRHTFGTDTSHLLRHAVGMDEHEARGGADADRVGRGGGAEAR